MRPLEYADLVVLHKEKFGVEPVITGINSQSSGDLDAKIVKAIQSGIPYVEQEVPDGLLT